MCLFLNMVLKKFIAEALEFLNTNKGEFLPHHKYDISVLETVQDLQRLEDPEISKYMKNKSIQGKIISVPTLQLYFRL